MCLCALPRTRLQQLMAYYNLRKYVESLLSSLFYPAEFQLGCAVCRATVARQAPVYSRDLQRGYARTLPPGCRELTTKREKIFYSLGKHGTKARERVAYLCMSHRESICERRLLLLYCGSRQRRRQQQQAKLSMYVYYIHVHALRLLGCKSLLAVAYVTRMITRSNALSEQRNKLFLHPPFATIFPSLVRCRRYKKQNHGKATVTCCRAFAKGDIR